VKILLHRNSIKNNESPEDSNSSSEYFDKGDNKKVKSQKKGVLGKRQRVDEMGPPKTINQESKKIEMNPEQV
jgi:hypothetical protein